MQAHTCCSETLGACEPICCRQCGHVRLSDCSSSRRRHAAQKVWPHGKSSVGRRFLPLISSRQMPHLHGRARAQGSGARKREGASSRRWPALSLPGRRLLAVLAARVRLQVTL